MNSSFCIRKHRDREREREEGGEGSGGRRRRGEREEREEVRERENDRFREGEIIFVFSSGPEAQDDAQKIRPDGKQQEHCWACVRI